jgi:hypothetical protein
MKITEGQFYLAINEFIEREIIPLGASYDAMEQILFYGKIEFAKLSIKKTVKNMFANDHKSIFSIIDENKSVEIDDLYEIAQNSLSRVKILKIAGFEFREDDLQKLYGIIQKYAN